MDERPRFDELQLLIIGLGLMGSSLALATKGRFGRVTGFDLDPETRQLAVEQNIVDHCFEDIKEAISAADVICLSVPVDRIIEILDNLPDLVPPKKDIVVFDLGSTKADIVKKMNKMPGNIHTIGAHPICGKEKLGIRNADRTLYYGAPFLLTRTDGTDQLTLDVIEHIIEALRVKASFIDPDKHDEVLGIVSHVPYLIAGALVMSTPSSVKDYFGPGYRSASRLAGTEASMMLPVVLSNKENILSSLENLVDELNILISMISEMDKSELQQYMLKVNEIYRELMGQ